MLYWSIALLWLLPGCITPLEESSSSNVISDAETGSNNVFNIKTTADDDHYKVHPRMEPKISRYTKREFFCCPSTTGICHCERLSIVKLTKRCPSNLNFTHLKSSSTSGNRSVRIFVNKQSLKPDTKYTLVAVSMDQSERLHDGTLLAWVTLLSINIPKHCFENQEAGCKTELLYAPAVGNCSTEVDAEVTLRAMLIPQRRNLVLRDFSTSAAMAERYKIGAVPEYQIFWNTFRDSLLFDTNSSLMFGMEYLFVRCMVPNRATKRVKYFRQLTKGVFAFQNYLDKSHGVQLALHPELTEIFGQYFLLSSDQRDLELRVCAVMQEMGSTVFHEPIHFENKLCPPFNESTFTYYIKTQGMVWQELEIVEFHIKKWKGFAKAEMKILQLVSDNKATFMKHSYLLNRIAARLEIFMRVRDLLLS